MSREFGENNSTFCDIRSEGESVPATEDADTADGGDAIKPSFTAEGDTARPLRLFCDDDGNFDRFGVLRCGELAVLEQGDEISKSFVGVSDAVGRGICTNAVSVISSDCFSGSYDEASSPWTNPGLNGIGLATKPFRFNLVGDGRFGESTPRDPSCMPLASGGFVSPIGGEVPSLTSDTNFEVAALAGSRGSRVSVCGQLLCVGASWQRSRSGAGIAAIVWTFQWRALAG